uniref:Uncharacterized protein n=1 Tax=viral metagenome TaxID=1070528 RepID=A0A6C0IYG9_9ZZZZ
MTFYNKIFNPKTHRYVSIKSVLGKKILSKYINKVGGSNPIPGIDFVNFTNLTELYIHKLVKEIEIANYKDKKRKQKKIISKLENDILLENKETDCRTLLEIFKDDPIKPLTIEILKEFSDGITVLCKTIIDLIIKNKENNTYVCLGNTPFKILKTIELLNRHNYINLPDNVNFKYIPFSGRSIDIKGSKKSNINNLFNFINYPEFETSLEYETIENRQKFDRELESESDFMGENISNDSFVRKYNDDQFKVFESMMNECLKSNYEDGNKITIIDFCDTCFGLMSFLYIASKTNINLRNGDIEAWILSKSTVDILTKKPIINNPNIKNYIDISENTTAEILDYVRKSQINGQDRPVLKAKILDKKYNINAKLIDINNINYSLLGNEALNDRCILEYKPDNWIEMWDNCYEKNYLINGYNKIENSEEFKIKEFLNLFYNRSVCAKVIIYFYIQYYIKYNLEII